MNIIWHGQKGQTNVIKSGEFIVPDKNPAIVAVEVEDEPVVEEENTDEPG